MGDPIKSVYSQFLYMGINAFLSIYIIPSSVSILSMQIVGIGIAVGLFSFVPYNRDLEKTL